MDRDESSYIGYDDGFAAKDVNITREENIGNTRKRKRGSGDDTNSNAGKAYEEFQQKGGTVVNRRKRGRPQGSKNKPMAPPPQLRGISNINKTHVLVVPTGVDVIKTIGIFVRNCNFGVFVISGSGKVSNVTLLEPAVPEGIVAHAQLFEIISLSGAFRLGADNQGATGLRTCVTDAQGGIVAGTLVGSMIACSRVIVVMMITAVNTHLERLNVNNNVEKLNANNHVERLNVNNHVERLNVKPKQLLGGQPTTCFEGSESICSSPFTCQSNNT